VGVSQLSNLGLTELICHTRDDYIAMASRLATDFARLGTWRNELRPRMAASPLTDAPRFTRHLEQVYRNIWRDWCLGRSVKEGTPGEQISRPGRSR